MLKLLPLLLFVAPAFAQTPTPANAETVEKTITALKDASKKPVDERVAVIRAAADVVDVKVIKEVASGLRDRDDAIKTATIEALRFMQHPSALDALHNTLKRDKKLRKNAELHAALIRAVGQHGSPESIDLLVDNLFAGDDYGVIRARIAALGNVRDKQAVDALFRLMKSGGRRRVQPFMKSLRLSLMVLTGADQGESQDLWHSWWNNNKKTLEVAQKEPRLPAKDQRDWDRFWGRERTYQRNKKRGERGQDPEN